MIEDGPMEQPQPGPKKPVRGSFLTSWLHMGEKTPEPKKPFSGRGWNLFENFFGTSVRLSDTLAVAPEAAQSFELLDSDPEPGSPDQPAEGGELLINHDEQPAQTNPELVDNQSVDVPHQPPAAETPSTNPFKEYEAQVQHEQSNTQGPMALRPEAPSSIAAPQEVPAADTRREIDFETRHEIKDESGSRTAAAYSARATTDAAYRTAGGNQPQPGPAAPVQPPAAEPPLMPAGSAALYVPEPDNSQLYSRAMLRGFWAGILIMAIWWLIYIAR